MRTVAWLSVRVAWACGALCLAVSLQQLCFHGLLGGAMQHLAIATDSVVGHLTGA